MTPIRPPSCNQSIPVEFVMAKDSLAAFQINDYIDEIRMKQFQWQDRAYPVVDSDNVVQGFITVIISSVKATRVILVDHNEISQSIDGLEQAQILK